MPSKKTTNYQLSQWVKTDKVLMDDFNKDNETIDAALAGKAEQSALSELETAVSKKAEQSALESLKQAVTGHTSELVGKGNCQICVKTYTGSGVTGPEGAVSLTFPGKPLLVATTEPDNGMFMVLVTGSPKTQSSSSISPITVNWTSSGVSWYHQNNLYCNTKGTTYTAVALLAVS